GIFDISAGINVTEETENIKGYTLGLRVTFEDLASLRSYGPHPVHQEFVKALDGILENVIVVDYPLV
ncbi:Dabb family protein, partial [Paenibacillus sp. 2RAB27]|uniref:Dabb family protein n=1 Tax=Paenibacillus sp. 2RAB27 TaxID=3232991 RepID=UPI003F96703F